MKYESEFRIKEKEFYPREKHSHKKVIDELANIVKRADLEIEELEKGVHKMMDIDISLTKERNALDARVIHLMVGLACSLILNAIFIYT